MPNINVRIIEWCKNSVLLAKAIKHDRLNALITDAFCDDSEKRTIASIDLYKLLWGTHPELGPCPDIEGLSSFEYDRVFHDDYRDHVTHAIKVFFLGLYLYENNETIKQNIDLRISELGLSENGNSFILIWTMTSLFHDIGYFLENEKIEHDTTLWDIFQKSITDKMRLPFSNTPFFSKYITDKKEQIFVNKNKIFTPNILSVVEFEDDGLFQELSDSANKSGLSLNSSKNGIQQYYQYAKSHRPTPYRPSYYDHGIVSALVLLKIWNAYADYFGKIVDLNCNIINVNDTFKDHMQHIHRSLSKIRLGVKEAADAIALHNIQKNNWKKEDTLASGIDLDSFQIKLEGDNSLPFAFLLRLVDELQCWDRLKHSAPQEKSLKGEDIDIRASSTMIYIWYKDDMRLKNPATDDSSEYRKLIDELSQFVKINGLMGFMDTYDEKKMEETFVDTKLEGAKGNPATPAHDASGVINPILIEEYLNYIVDKFSENAKIYADQNAEEIGSIVDFVKPEAKGFVSRTFQAYQPLSHSFEVPQDPVQVEGFDEMVDYFLEYERVALTGDPGSGKSTTLEHATYKFATMYLEEKSNLIPVLIHLGGMRGEPVETYLSEHIDKRVQNLFNTDWLVLLLDGLNEISAQDADRLGQWIINKPNQYLVVTCRRVDYIERQLPLKRIDIEPLDLMHIWTMMGKYLDEGPRDKLFWSLAGADAERAWKYYTKRHAGVKPFESFWYSNIGQTRPTDSEKATISVLQKELREQKKMPGILPLLSNPFLLYAAIIMYYNNQEAPKSRREVLTGFAIAMLDKAEIRTNLLRKDMQHKIQADLNIDSSLEGDKVCWIAYIAFRMFERGFGTAVPLPWLQAELTAQFQGKPVKGFIENLITGNLLDRIDKTTQFVKFRYQIMQEFFAAVHLCINKNYDELPAVFKREEWYEPSAWDETIRIAAELLPDSTALIQSIYVRKPDLAYSCILNGVYCKDEVLQELLNPSKDPASPRARAAWGASLAADGEIDDRKGVGIKNGLPDFDWILVKGGQVVVGCEGEESAKMGVAGHTVSVEIKNDFFISKYPTTRSQFEAFLKDGYEDKENWCELGWRWKGTRSCPELWFDKEYGLSNAPVVGVSWFEAMAFCQWASRKLESADWEIDLPLEAEWEHAAHFPDGRAFPWGNVFLPGYANIDESTEGAACGPFSLGKAASVGVYTQGLSALGIADMCGNVWEWCKSRWDFRYEWPEIVASEKVDHRVIKGGSWYNSVRFANSGIHDCLDADLGVNDVGFRVIKKRRSANNHNISSKSSKFRDEKVKKILVLGTPNSGRTEFVRSVSDLPLVKIHKKDFSSDEQIPMDYGRRYYTDSMYYFYAPLNADDSNLDRFHEEMHGVIFIFSGCIDHSHINIENLSSMLKLCKDRKIPILVAVSGSDLTEFSLNRYDIKTLQDFGVTVSPFSAVERSSCTLLLDILFEQTKGGTSIIGFEKPKVMRSEVEAIVKQYRHEHVKRVVNAGGVPNVTFIIEFDSGEPIALRICNIGYTRKAHLEFEIDILSYLEKTGFIWSPRLVPLLDAPGWIGSWGKFPVITTKVIKGSTGDREPATVQLCTEIGKAVGEMRNVLARYEGSLPPEEDFWSRSERLLNELKISSVQKSWGITPSLVIDAFEKAKKTVLATRFINEVVHSDVWPPNVMVLDGHLSGILDFDDLAIGPGILDLASVIGEFGFDRENDILIEKNVSAIIHGFNTASTPVTHETGMMILPLIEASYCSWLACNALHRMPFAESKMYYRRLDQLRSFTKREHIEETLLRIITIENEVKNVD
jgi:formylglycine-generating enzyme required for sulfatase activity/Ser/Thr protein kinase RdoA (MazF antagonist)/signal recognition particle receptor subunit beta